MKSGQIIKLRGCGGEELVRRVVKLDKDIVVVCRTEEYEAAHLEGREPISVGFHIEDVLDEQLEPIGRAICNPTIAPKG
jgi:hypothetical protein